MGNCCFKLPIPSHTNGNVLLDSLEEFQSNKDWVVLDHETAGINGSSSSSRGGEDGEEEGEEVPGLLTMILTLEDTSNLEKTQQFMETHAAVLKNILFSKPRRSSTSASQPNWSTPQMTLLFETIGRLPHLEVLLLHEVGTSSNPIPIYLLTKVLAPVHPRLKQTYLVGHFLGDAQECHQLAAGLQQQPQLQSFALYGNASRQFTLDPILQAVSSLTTLKYLYFHGNMPHPLTAATIQKVGGMHRLETLTIHSCDSSGHNLTALAKCLESSPSLKQLTVFEAFELFQHGSQQPCAKALYRLICRSRSLKKVQIWFGFCADSAVLQQFAHALAINSNITHFETAILWTNYDNGTARVFVDILRHNTHLEKLSLCGYQGKWRLPLWFYVRLNQTGRGKYVQEGDRMTVAEWIDVLTTVPPLMESCVEDSSAPAAAPAALDDAPADPDWFATSWRYYYLRMQPSILPRG